MPKKIVIDHLAGRAAGKRQELEATPRVRFGRHPENEIAFDAYGDLDASTRHAELREEEGAYWLVDVGSSNGTFVGGQRIHRQAVVIGQPLEAEFGAGGPRCRIFVGDADAVPPPKTTVAAAVKDPRMVGDPASARVPGRRTAVLASMVERALDRSHRRFRVVGALLIAMVALAALGFWRWSVRLAGRAREVQADIARHFLEEERERKAAVAGVGPRIAADNHDGVFLLASARPDGTVDSAFCSAFAVGERTLATNAHCVAAIAHLGEADAHLEAFAVRNGDPSHRYRIVDTKTHPAYTGSRVQLSPDVGIVTLDAPVGPALHLADAAGLARLTTGAHIYMYGFPGRLADPARPEATLTEGIVGRITTWSGEVGAFPDNLLVQHSAFTTGGTSGSPLFDADGAVVALNAGGYVGLEQQVVQDETTKKTKVVDVGAALAGYSYAIRVDALALLLAAVEREGASR